MTEPIQHVTVCICTYKRPHLLVRLLKKIAAQETGGRFTFSVVVSDNDQAQSAQSVVQELAAATGMSIKYCVEPRQSIAMARNNAVGNATGDFIAFIDDDEFPADGWLLHLVQACAEHNADGVLGPVRRHFDEKPPEWIEKSSFYERPEYATGYVLAWRQGRSGNLLFKREMLSTEAQPFDPQFRTGEDQDFLRRMMNQGRVFVWCNEAPVYEVVPPVRWKRAFLIKRAFLRGAMEPKVKTFGISDVVKSAVAVPLYALALPIVFLFGQHKFMSLLVRLCDHLGKLLALMGIHVVHEEYVTD
jgi:glycosyltransferase involved in cell wall biosynthesis